MTPVQALQETLAGEHAAVYLYGLYGGRVSDSADPSLAARLTSAYTTHRRRRDDLVERVRHHGAEPVAAAVSYRPPNPCRTDAQLAVAARVTEQRCASVYATAVGSTSGADRSWAVGALTDTAVRLLGFGAPASAWPGAAEL